MVKNPPANAGDMGSILISEKSPGEGNDNPFQYSCLGNSTDGGAWWATAHGLAKVKHNFCCARMHQALAILSLSNLICNKGLEIVLTSKRSK